MGWTKAAIRCAALGLIVGAISAARAETAELTAAFLGPSESSSDGARLAVADTESTGKFLGLGVRLKEFRADDPAAAVAAVQTLKAEGLRFVVSALDGAALDAALTAPGAADLVFLNAGAPDDRFRNGPCRPNLLHTLPSRAMLADSLAQFLIKKRWSRWFLIEGANAGDRLYADALRRAAKRFGGKIVASKLWPDNGDMIRTAQAEVPVLTQGPDYDVVLTADEAGIFGPYIPYHTWDPRPVAGTHGLSPAAWHPSVEQWGALQLQSRFQKIAGRPMNAVDYAAWAAVRALGEAVVRNGSADAGRAAATLFAPDFEMAGFKGRRLSFRDWNGQLRQPIPLSAGSALTSQSPQEGFLHPVNDMDTLGWDRPESQCKGRSR